MQILLSVMNDDKPTLNQPTVEPDDTSTQSSDKNVYIEFVKTKYSTIKVAVAPVLILFLLVGIGLSVYQIQRQQDIRRRAAAGDVALRFEANKTYLAVGEEATVKIQMDTQNYDVSTANVYFTFPSSLLVSNLKEAAFLSVPLDNPIITDATANIQVGSPPFSPAKGSGTIATFKVKALAPTDLATVSFDKTKTQIYAIGLQGQNVAGTYSDLPIQIQDSTEAPTGTASLKVTATGTVLTPGQEYDFPIEITSATAQVTGSELAVLYSTQHFDFVSFTTGPFFSFALRDVRKITPTYLPNSEVAILEVGTSPTQPKQGTGIAGTLRLRVKPTAPTTATLIQFDQNAKISALGQAGTNILSRRSPLSVTFTGVTNTPTPTPTRAPTPTALPNTVSLSIQADKNTAAVGEEIPLTIQANTNGIPVTGAELHVTFSSTVFQMVSFIKGGSLPVGIVNGITESGGAQISVGSSTQPFNGTGTIATLTLKVKNITQTTDTTIAFSNQTLVSAFGQAGNNVAGNKTPITMTIVAAPTNTPTPTPTLTPTRAPTFTPIPTVTINPTNTRLGLLVKVEGIGADEISSTKEPRNPSRAIEVQIVNTQNQLIKTVNSVLNYDTNQYFSGEVDLGSALPAQNYLVKVKFANSLRRQIKNLVGLAPSQRTDIPKLVLVTGDIDNNNILDLSDYKLFLDCFRNQASCTTAVFEAADLNSNGQSDAVDMNILVRSFATREGD